MLSTTKLDICPSLPPTVLFSSPMMHTASCRCKHPHLGALVLLIDGLISLQSNFTVFINSLGANTSFVAERSGSVASFSLCFLFGLPVSKIPLDFCLPEVYQDLWPADSPHIILLTIYFLLFSFQRLFGDLGSVS